MTGDAMWLAQYKARSNDPRVDAACEAFETAGREETQRKTRSEVTGGGKKQPRAAQVSSNTAQAPRVARRRHLIDDALVQITLPIPPSVNGMYAAAGRGQRRLTPKARDWKAAAAITVRAAHTHPRPFTGAVAVEITITRADKRRSDIDNPCKCLLDALEDGGLLKDDAQIVELHVFKRAPNKLEPRAELRVTPAKEQL